MADDQDLNINIGSNPSGVEAGSRRAKTSIKGVTDESKKLDAAFVRLRAAIDPTFKATEKYNRTLADAKKLLDANKISKDQYAAASKIAKTTLDQETAALQRNSAAGRAAAGEAKRLKQEEAETARRVAQEKIAAARLERQAKERLEKEEQRAIRLAATLAREAAREANRATRPASARAVGRVDPALAEGSRSLKQLENDIARAMSKAETLSARATAAAGRAAKATSSSVAQAAQASAQKAAAAAEEAHARVINLSKQKAAVVAADAEREAQAVRAAEQSKKAAARESAQAAIAASKAKAKADREAITSSREAARAVAAQAKAERQHNESLQELRSSIDPVFAAQTRYNDVMRRATALLMNNKLKTGEWVAIQRQAKAQMDVNVRSMGRMNTIGVQMGYQMQDVTASIASGINPLVILAQQGGQTAAALSMMGGTVGRVASFMAGPWGAAVIGFTLLLGYLWQSEDEGKKKTIDLKNAEDFRTATVKQLTAALRDYIQAQKESNNTALENLRIINNTNYTVSLKMARELTAAEQELKDAREELKRVSGSGYLGDPQGQGGAIIAATMRITKAEQTLAAAKEGVATAEKAHTESKIALLSATAELTKEDLKHQANLQKITDTYRASTHAVEDNRRMYADLRAENDRYTEAKKAETEARRENTKAAQAELAAFIMPANGPITSGFGPRNAPLKPDGSRGSRNHKGIDIGVPVGTPVQAPQVGTIKSVGFSPEEGKYVVIDHGAGTTTRYMHLSETSKGVGEHVAQGEVFAKSGNTGGVKAHLHYGVYINGKPVDPRKGVFGVDTLAAEERGMNQLETAAQKAHRVAEEALQDQVAGLDFQKELAGEDLMQVLQIQDEKEAAIKAFYGENSREAQNAGRETLRLEKQIAQQQVNIARETYAKKLQIAEIATQAEYDRRQMLLDLRGGDVDFRQSTGQINERQALIEKATILDEEAQMQLNHENTIYQMKYNSIRDQLALENLLPEARRALLDQLEIMEAEHQARIAGIQNQYAQNVRNVQNQSGQIVAGKWREVASTMTQSMNTAFQGIWTHSVSGWQTLINIADQMVYKLVDIGLKWLEDFIVKQGIKLGIVQANQAVETGAVAAGEATRTGITATGETTREGIGAAGVIAHGGQQVAKQGATVAAEAIQTGAKIGGEATRTTVGATGAVAEIGTRAATSAAGAFSSTVVIPFIGPVAAPIAAAAALAAVLGFAALVSAKGGQGEVGQDGQLSMLHKKEMVLPAWIAEPMRNQLRAGGSSAPMFNGAAKAGAAVRDTVGGNRLDATFNYQPQNQFTDFTFDEALRRDGRTLRRWFNNQVRNGAIRMDPR